MSMDGFKKQMALIDKKSRREELKLLLNTASGGGSWRRICITRIDTLTKEIKVIEGSRVDVAKTEELAE